MKRFITLLVLTVLSCPPLSGAEPSPNVLFIICDDLNCDLGSYGHPQVKSPNIDRLAKSGVRFEHAYCQYPLCGPSRASFMTGMYPDQTLIRRNAILLRSRLPDVVSLSQHFHQNGYEAIRIGKIYHYNVPADIGNDGHDDPASWTMKFNPRGRDKNEEKDVFSLRPGSYGGTLSWLAQEGTDAQQTDGIAADKAVELLQKHAKSKKPFFMAVGMYRPHTPYVAPKKYFDMYPVEKIKVPKVPDGYLDTLPAPAQKSLTRKKEQLNLEVKIARQAIRAYYASITFVDAQIGRVLDALEKTGLAGNTIVLFTSDHGYHMGEHGHYQKTTLFENAARVPLIIRTPGKMKTAGQTARTMSEMVDFYPTLAELCELKAPANVSGVSLVPALKDPTAIVKTSALTQYSTGYSIRTSRYRYSEWGDKGAAGAELYDHESDSNEMKNLARDPATADLVKRFSSILRKRISQAGQKPAGVRQIPARPAKPKKGRKKKQTQP